MRKGTTDKTSRGERGVALIAVLGFLAAMSLITIGVVSAARTTIANASRHLDRAQAQAAIESGIEYAASQLATARGTAPTLLSSPETLKIGGIRVQISVRPERAKVDPNYADANLLAALFRAGGASFDQAQALASAVEDWRDGDELVHLNGAERRQYEAAGLAYGPANKYFTSVDELRLVFGVTGEIFGCIRPQLTILTQSPGIDVESAAPMIRRELGLQDEAGAKGLAGPTIVGGQLITPGEVFEITARLEDPAKQIRRSERVAVRITGNPADAYWSLNIEPALPLEAAARRDCPSPALAHRPVGP
jgi:general secretion pathway protein K